MKNYLRLVFSILISFQTLGQQFLIPMRVGDKFGLCDETKKMIINPDYDKINWIKQSFFMTRKNIDLVDTLRDGKHHAYVRSNQKTQVTGIIYKGKEILKNEPFRSYEIYNQSIIGRCEKSVSELTQEQFDKYNTRCKNMYSLFNLKGINTYPENFSRLHVIEKTGKSENYTGSAKYVLFLCENFTKQNSLFIYDTDQQKISNWLLKDVTKINIEEMDEQTKTIQIDYLENAKKCKKIIAFNNGNFRFTDEIGNRNELTQTVDQRGNSNENLAIDYESGFERSDANPAIYLGNYYILRKDNMFGLVRSDKTIALPFEYDSIRGKFQELVSKSEGNYEKEYSYLTFRDKEDYLNNKTEIQSRFNGSSIYIQVFKNGKTGVVDEKNNIILPIEYDQIATNGLNYVGPLETNFIILKKGNLFGIGEIKNKFELIVKPIFPYIPTAYYNNYYANSGMKIYELCNDKFETICYGTEKGEIFIK